MNENTNKSQFPQGLPFTQIFKTFRLSIQPSKLFLSLFAIALICLTGWLMDLSKTVIVTNQNNNYKNQTKQQNITELDIYLSNPQNFESKISGIKENSNSQGLFKTLWRFARSKFNASLSSLFAFNFKDIAVHITEYLRAIEWALKYHLIYCLIFVLIKLSIIAVFGGAICRMSALQYAKNEKPGMFAALSFSLKRFTNFFAAPLIPIFLITVVGLLAIASFALTANIPLLGGFITAVFIPLIFLAGAFIAFLIIGAAAGFNLMFPAICYDGSDCFDAMSRSFSYIYAKPWTFGFYSALAAVYAAVCYLFVRLFVFLSLFSSRLFMQIAIWTKNADKTTDKINALWPKPSYINLIEQSVHTPGSTDEKVLAFMIQLFSMLAIGLILAFIFSFYFSANTIIYASLRKKVDDNAIDDIYTQTKE